MKKDVPIVNLIKHKDYFENIKYIFRKITSSGTLLNLAKLVLLNLIKNFFRDIDENLKLKKSLRLNILKSISHY